MDLFLRLHLTTLHAVPLLFSTLNIVVTDMKFEVSDWKKMVFMGFQYLIANGIGTYVQGKPLYPIVDWKNIPLTVFLFVL